MLWCKVIGKIKSNDNTEWFTVCSKDGETRQVTKEQLKTALANNSVSLVNYKLSKDGKLVQRNITDEVRFTKLYFGQNEITEEDDKIRLKSQLIGIAPEINENGYVISLPSASKIAITANIKGFTRIGVSDPDVLLDKTLIFYGNNPVNVEGISYKSDTIKEIICMNRTLIDSILKGDLRARNILIDTDDLNIKIIDTIFKTYKEDSAAAFRNEYSVIRINNEKISKADAYNRTLAILKRQKPSSEPDRRCRDLTAYLRLIYSMYVSYGDPAILSLATDYITEYRGKIFNTVHKNKGQFVNLIRINEDATRDIINKIEQAR